MKKILWLTLILTLLISSQAFACPPSYVTDPNTPPAGDYTIDGNLDLTSTATNHLMLPMNADDATPTICFDGGSAGVTCDTGLHEESDGVLYVDINGTERWIIQQSFLGSLTTSGGTLWRLGSTSTDPFVFARGDTNTGLCRAGEDQACTVAGGVEAQRWTEAPREIEANTSVCVIATDNVTTTAAHALAVDDVVVFTDGAGDVCAPLVSGTNYYVETVTDANNIKVAATRGGSAIDITEDASGVAFTSTELEITVNTYGDTTNNGFTTSGYRGVTTTASGRVMTTVEMSNGVVIATAVMDLDLPDLCDSATGAIVTVVARDAEVLSIGLTDTNDSINLNGATLGADDELDSGGTAFESATITCLETNEWFVITQQGTWVDGGVAD